MIKKIYESLPIVTMRCRKNRIPICATRRCLRQQGLGVRVFEAGSDVGGTWYWNRYPGARCDVESMEYSYQFDEDLQQEWEWKERYASQGEILAYAQHVADRFTLRDDIQFNTRVSAMSFDEKAAHWLVSTDDGRQSRANFVIAATGCLSVPASPRFPGCFCHCWALPIT